MDSEKSELRWGVAQRLEFIEFRLFWEGRVNRSDLMEQFGLSVSQASANLNRYIGFAPDNMVYDKKQRHNSRLSGKCQKPSPRKNGRKQGKRQIDGRDLGGWRRDRDSNPGDGLPPTHFPGVRLRPLGHLSTLRFLTSNMCCVQASNAHSNNSATQSSR